MSGLFAGKIRNETYKHAFYSLQKSKLDQSDSCIAKLSTELGAICARVLTVSNGCPIMTCDAPATPPAMSSLIVFCVLDVIFFAGEYGIRLSGRCQQIYKWGLVAGRFILLRSWIT